jgi:hypothetical protein
MEEEEGEEEEEEEEEEGRRKTRTHIRKCKHTFCLSWLVI